MREQYLRQGDCFLLVYSVTDPDSFSHIAEFRNRIMEVKGVKASSKSKEEEGGEGDEEERRQSSLPMILVQFFLKKIFVGN